MRSQVLEKAQDLPWLVADRVASRLIEGTPVLGPVAPTPPGPRGSLIRGNWTEGWNDPLALFARCQAEFGPIARLRFGPHFYYLLNDPDLIHHVMHKNAKNYRKSRYYRGIKRVLGDGLFTSEGDFWRRQRRLAGPAFHRERLNAFAATMTACTRDALPRLKELVGKTLSVEKEMSRLALRIVCRTLFSAEVGADSDAVARAVSFANEFAERTSFLPAWVPTTKNRELKEALAVFDGIVTHMLEERRSGRASPATKGDVLSMLMAARDEETGEGMSDRQLRDEALTMIIGGHETTATVLTWTFYLLSLNPAVERRLRAHVREVLGDRDPTADDLQKLGYVTQVIQESMRLYPPAWVMEREALAEDQLGGYRIPAGATVAVSSYVFHRHPAYWTNPEGFDPDRFAPELARERPRQLYLPFGSGPRQCIGNGFAMMETVIILSMLVRELSLDLVAGHKVELEPVTTLRPKYGMRMIPRLASTS
jgi:cytochrome P450